MIIMIYREFLTLCISYFGEYWEQALGFFILLAVFIFVCYSAWDSDRCRKLVIENSGYYKSVLELNEYTEYHPEIAQEGKVHYVMYVDSKAKFDRTEVKASLFEYLSLYGSEMWEYLRMVSENRRSYRAYISAFEEICSSITREECQILGIEYDRFWAIEERLVASKKLNMIQELSITCIVEYTSPKGQNHYEKGNTYLESEIRTAMQHLITKEAYTKSEEWRRKNERSKVTPSLRYDVMQRDGFKCCLCGRSASNGVELEVDHIVPVSKGGSTTYSNLQTLCRECNRGKGAKMLE